MDHTVYVYIDADDEYLRWLEEHPDGYVVNTNRSLSPGYLILHEARCGQLHRLDPRQARMTFEYVKVCSASREQLEKWANWTLPGQPQLHRCNFCRPE